MFSFELSLSNIVRCIWIEIFLILYIFDIVPIFGIEKVGTRIYLSLFALFYIVYKYRNSKYYWLIIIANWSQIFFSVLTAILNSTNDFWYVQFALRNILYLNGALFIVDLIKANWTYVDFVKLIIIAIIINSFIATISYFVPSFGNFILSIHKFSGLEQIQSMVNWHVRMWGLGISKFFVGGIINGMGIILSFWLLGKRKIKTIPAAILIVILLLVGVFIARTTIVGFLLGLILYIYETNAVKLVPFIACSTLASVLLYFVMPESVNTSHAFEFFTLDSDDFTESDSLSSLINMYDVSMNFYTLFIGDGMSKGGGHIYYMGVDVGWLRNIFYFGILGTVFGYLYYEYVIHRLLYKLSGVGMAFVVTWFSYLLILNFKGLPDFNFMVFLLLAYPLKRYRSTVKVKYGQKIL